MGWGNFFISGRQWIPGTFSMQRIDCRRQQKDKDKHIKEISFFISFYKFVNALTIVGLQGLRVAREIFPFFGP
jgi:hypothetical protein